MAPAQSAAIKPAVVPASPHGDHAAKIGPNAVIQLIQALTAAGLDDAAKQIFAAAGVGDWLARPPGEMIDERPVAAIHQAVRRLLPPDQAVAVLTDAGRRTGDYILANRIPKFAQTILKLLPAPLAARMLVKAITAHSWTFAGSGRFSGQVGRNVVFEIVGNPICAGEHAETLVCVWHAAVFQRLFQVLVSPRSRAVETACGAHGDACCRFVVDWKAVPERSCAKAAATDAATSTCCGCCADSADSVSPDSGPSAGHVISSKAR
ncbi:bacteriochlorophyll 4-vinyl reductase [Rhodopseudomonas palustris]|uniref:Bacteriochlorophyll 4-vinyl reductase n=1 Tax=Rhodopseudomonas palustris (strain BisB18) TaxID=316056 RepID=Q20ZT9_RHOPB